MARVAPKVVKAGAIRPPKAVEMNVRALLLDIAEKAQLDAMTIIQAIESGNISAIQAANALEEMLHKWEGMDSKSLAEMWVTATDGFAKKRLQDRVANAFGVQTAYIFDDESVRYAAHLMAYQTAGKIVDVPREYIQNVARAAIQNYQGIPFPEGRSLTQQIMHENHMTFERARTVARHQTSVINTAVNQARQTAIGIDEYYWSSSNDERTVGNPNGLYPYGNKAHGDHWERDYRHNGGEAYRWDDPFEDGLPGYPPRCRCTALAKLDRRRMMDSGRVAV